MREGPRQASNLDPIDRDSLAIIGHRIERWDILRDESLSVEERKQTLVTDIEHEIESLRQHPESDELELQIEELTQDVLDIRAIDDTPEALEELFEERKAYYTEVRREFLTL